jgi:hypothetical protein
MLRLTFPVDLTPFPKADGFYVYLIYVSNVRLMMQGFFFLHLFNGWILTAIFQ